MIHHVRAISHAAVFMDATALAKMIYATKSRAHAVVVNRAPAAAPAQA